MQATLTLDENEIKEAIKEYLQNRGWNSTAIKFAGYQPDDQRGYKSSYITANIIVTNN